MKAWTIILVILVVVTAWPAWRPTTVTDDGLRGREGQVIGRAEADALAVRDLELITWDAEQGRPIRFRVVHEPGAGWVIPSHHRYPADAQEQVGRTAGSVLGKTFGRWMSNSPQDHALYGVSDPADEEALLAQGGHGTRIILRDQDNAPIIDLIVGRATDDRSGTRFVREAGTNAVYTAELDILFSTRFTDWVNRRLIDVDSADIRSLIVDHYRVDGDRGTVVDRQRHALSRSDGASDFEPADDPPPGRALDQEVVQSILSRVTALNLHGVRPMVSDEQYLQRHGLFQATDHAFYGDRGSLFLITDEGLQYSLFFGSIARGDGLALSAGLESTDETEAADEEGGYRYLAIIVGYDPNSDVALQAAQAAAQTAPEATDDEADDRRDPEAIIAERNAQVEALNERFLRFFYVIDEASLYELRPDTMTLFTVPEADPDGDEGAPKMAEPPPVVDDPPAPQE